MSENRELTMDDYLAMLRRRLKVILIPALIAPLAGFLVSYAPLFPPKYASQATVLVESQKVPDSYVMPVITADFIQRVNALEQQVLTTAKLQRMLESPALSAIVKSDQVGRLIEDIQHNTSVDAVITPMSAEAGLSGSKKRKPSATDEPVPGFHVNYFDSDPVRAQKICNALTDQFGNVQTLANAAKQIGRWRGARFEEEVASSHASISAQPARGVAGGL
jgi:hypothetical protein